MSQAIFNQGPVNATLINNVATATVTPQMNGTTFICQKLAGGNCVVTLPDPTIAGLRYRFIMANNEIVVAHVISLQAPVDTMAGIWVQVDGTATPSANPIATRNANFTATAQWGDVWDLVSDGTFWNAYGLSGVANGLSFT